MRRSLSRNTWSGPAGRGTQAGTVLTELLVALLVMGTGLLSTLTLFPLGTLEMAQAIPDDRTGAVATEATTLSRAGEQLVLRTADFVESSLSTGSVDPCIAAELRQEYERLALRAEALESQLQALQAAFPSEQIQPYLGRLDQAARGSHRAALVAARDP